MNNVNDYYGIIYCYTSPSGKSYIGQTTNELKRIQQHKRLAYNQNDRAYNCKFYQAIRKYGWDSFDYKVLLTIISDNEQDLNRQLDEKEIYYIGLYDSYNNGYNMTIGGSALRREFHPSYGTRLTEEHKRKLIDSVSKQVSQYDINGNYIATYDSAAKAQVETGCDSSQIIAICRGNAFTSKGYQWRYGDSTSNIGHPTIPKSSGMKGKFGKENPRSKTIYQYSFTGQLINIWDAALCAEREAGYSSTALSKAIKNKVPYGKMNQQKYIWSFKPLEQQNVVKLVEKWNIKKAKSKRYRNKSASKS